jgi:hypothetical protein
LRFFGKYSLSLTLSLSLLLSPSLLFLRIVLYYSIFGNKQDAVYEIIMM